jgi:hypothetical protein
MRQRGPLRPTPWPLQLGKGVASVASLPPMDRSCGLCSVARAMAYLDAACRARYARLPRVHLGRHPAEVSIHARPGRGARPSGLAVQSIDEAFQSTRAPGGARDFGGKLPVFVFDWFQSTRAPGGARDGHDLTLHAVTCCFNPRAPREGRATLGGAAFGASREVSIHARPGRGARPGSAPVASWCCFNPRAPREGRATSKTASRTRWWCCFNPRAPREGRATHRRPVVDLVQRVSIHARPGRGARPASQINLLAGGVFQSTRAPGGARDTMPGAFGARWTSFNPRAPREGRATAGDVRDRLGGAVSIHARPGRGARLSLVPLTDICALFQSTRAPGGARDVGTLSDVPIEYMFQSTRAPGGARDTVVASPGPCGHFLPPSANLPRQGRHCDCAASSARRSSLRRAVLGAARSSPDAADAWGSRITPPARRRSRWRESARARAPRSRAHRPADTAAGSLCRGR